MSGVSITTPISRHISSAPPTASDPSGGPRSDCPSATTFHCFSSGSHAMAPHVQAILALRSHFLDPVQDALNSPRRIARPDLPPHEPHEDGSSERLHAH